MYNYGSAGKKREGGREGGREGEREGERERERERKREREREREREKEMFPLRSCSLLHNHHHHQKVLSRTLNWNPGTVK